MCSKGPRLEKVVDAHKGAVIVVKWSNDGSALLSAGEDGQVKIWSRSIMLRSVLIPSGD
jgi:intraflagellar transport protein 80